MVVISVSYLFERGIFLHIRRNPPPHTHTLSPSLPLSTLADRERARPTVQPSTSS